MAKFRFDTHFPADYQFDTVSSGGGGEEGGEVGKPCVANSDKLNSVSQGRMTF